MPLFDRRTKPRRESHATRLPRTLRGRLLLLLVAILVVAAAPSAASLAASRTGHATATITVWTDATRLPAFKLYQKTHPDAHLKIVSWDGDGNGPATLQTKLTLYNRTGHGWPDVVFSQNPQDISFIASPPYNFAAPLDKLLPPSTLKGYPKAVAAECEINGQAYCLKNDLAQNMIWYNATLMKQFGYAVPTTWEQYEQLGLKVAKEHPGYIIGALGSNTTQTYFWASRCPQNQPVGNGKLLINLESPLCTRAVTMLDELLAAKAVTPLSEYSPDFTKKYATSNKILMMIGASWFGVGMFDESFHTPKGQVAAAPPPKWASDSQAWTGALGGGIYFISRHAADQKAAADVINWVATSPKYQDTGPTYPGYGPEATRWLAKHTGTYFASPLGPAFKKAASEIWPGYGYVKFNDAEIWASSVVPVISKGGTIASAIKDYGNQLTQQAKINGYQVVTK